MNLWQYFHEHAFVVVHDDEIVSIADVMFLFESVLYELIKFIHVHVHEKLRCQVTEWQSPAWAGTLETADHGFDKPDSVSVAYVPFYYSDKRCLINRCKEFPYIAFQNPACPAITLRNLSHELVKSLECTMSSLEMAAGVGIVNEFLIEVRIQYAINSVMEESVSDHCFMDASRLRVAYRERFIRTVSIHLGPQVLMKPENVL